MGSQAVAGTFPLSTVIPTVYERPMFDSSPIIFHFVMTLLQVSLQSNTELCLEYELGSLGFIFVL